jgi:hypothetical protein
MDLTIYSANPSELELENSQLREIVEILKAAEPAASPVCMITNILLGNINLHSVLLTEKGPIIIDCKKDNQDLSEKDPSLWEMTSPSDHVEETELNPIEILKIQRFGFLRIWRKIVDKHFSKQIPEKQILHFGYWLYYQPEDLKVDEQINNSKNKWFHVVTKDNLIEHLNSIHNQYRISKAGYDKILHEIGLESLPAADIRQYLESDGQQDAKGAEMLQVLNTRSGPVPVIIQKKIVQITMPVRTQRRTSEFLNAFQEATKSLGNGDYERALRLIDFALKKDKYDQEAQILKYDILSLLGKDKDAEEFLLKAAKM